ncbi:MAG: hypothetical protein PVH87_08000 [Desulfobacteraceae bacterium]
MNRFHGANAESASFRKRFFTFYLPASMMLCAVIFGCGNEDASTKAADSADSVQACDLLTSAEVEAIIGAPIDTPRKTHHEQEGAKPWMSMCNYYSETKQIGLGVTIMPHGRKVTGQEAFALFEADLKEGLGEGYKLEIVNGVGDYAGWDESTKQLTVFKGPFMVIVGIISPRVQGAAALDLNRRLAEKFLEKL